MQNVNDEKQQTQRNKHTIPHKTKMNTAKFIDEITYDEPTGNT